MINKLSLFIDGSTNNQLKVGCGAYLVVNENGESDVNTKHKINIKTFKNTSSTKLELQTLLWALSELQNKSKEVVVYTDSQNIIGLPRRRIILEQNDYKSKKDKLLNNHELYRKFYKITERISCEFVKVKGHQPDMHKDNNDKLFTLVDRAARKALKNVKN